MRYLSLTLIALALSFMPAQAEQTRRGLITSGACPLDCEDLGVPASSCKQWAAGTKCFVEDSRSPAGHRSIAIVSPTTSVSSRAVIPKISVDPADVEKMGDTSNRGNLDNPTLAQNSNRRGLITTSNCPYTCADAGVPKKDCREYKTGANCSVEDLAQAPGHRSMLKVQE